MTRDKNKTQVLHADPEHGRLRITVLVLMVTAVGGSFFLLNWLLPQFIDPAFTPLLPCLAALPLGLGLAWLGECWLKQNWPSGKTITLLADGLHVDTGTPNGKQHFIWGQNLTMQGWHFTVGTDPQNGRERRLAPNLVCLSAQLMQGKERLVVYTYAPPEMAARLLQGRYGRYFQALDYEAVTEKPGLLDRMGPPKPPHIPTEALAGANGRLWLAEKTRLQTGLELRPEDFEILVTAVDKDS